MIGRGRARRRDRQPPGAGVVDERDLEAPGYVVRRVDPPAARKAYVCPACANGVAPGEGHLVVWPVGQADRRRHWHRHCWRIEVRRGGGKR